MPSHAMPGPLLKVMNTNWISGAVVDRPGMQAALTMLKSVPALKVSMPKTQPVVNTATGISALSI